MKPWLGLLFYCAPLLASEQIYRWVDAQGQVHFGQNPPASGAYQNVTPVPADLVSPGPPIQSPHRDSQDPQRAAADQQLHQQALKIKADNAERCAKAHERLSFLEEQTPTHLSKTGDDGQPVRISDEEFQQEVGDAKAAAAKYCE